MASEHQTTNATLQEHDHRQPRRSSARRKPAKGGGDSKKKKQPQRGMGVEKLERLRLQETPETNKPDFLTFTNPVHLPFSDMNHLQFARNPAAYPGFQYGSDHHHRLLHNHVHLFGINDSKVTGNVVKCYSLHCNACHKKKKINGEMCKAGDHRRDNQNMVINQDSLHNLGAVGNCGNKVEVMAVHRKGSCSSWDGGNRVLMEYDFFPSAAKSGGASIDSDDGEMAVMKQPAGFDDSDCVDLSLKLSY